MTDPIAVPSAAARTVLLDVADLCRRGWAANDRGEYARIRERLATLEQTEKVAALGRLASGGDSLSSARFAYPHIQERAEELADEAA